MTADVFLPIEAGTRAAEKAQHTKCGNVWIRKCKPSCKLCEGNLSVIPSITVSSKHIRLVTLSCEKKHLSRPKLAFATGQSHGPHVTATLHSSSLVVRHHTVTVFSHERNPARMVYSSRARVVFALSVGFLFL